MSNGAAPSVTEDEFPALADTPELRKAGLLCGHAGQRGGSGTGGNFRQEQTQLELGGCSSQWAQYRAGRDLMRKQQGAWTAAHSGDDAAAKTKIASLCTDLGWHPMDVGPLSSALHLEHMTLLWVKMGRMQGKGAGFVWAMLER